MSPKITAEISVSKIEDKKGKGREDTESAQWNSKQDPRALGPGSKDRKRTSRVREYRQKVETGI